MSRTIPINTNRNRNSVVLCMNIVRIVAGITTVDSIFEPREGPSSYDTFYPFFFVNNGCKKYIINYSDRNCAYKVTRTL